MTRRAPRKSLTASHAPMSADEKLLTVTEVAAMARVSIMSIYRLVHSGELESVTVGRNFRIKQSSTEKYLKVSVVDKDSPSRPAIGVAMMFARIALGFTQEQLAEKLDVHSSTVSKAELTGYGSPEFWSSVDKTLGLGGKLAALREV